MKKIKRIKVTGEGLEKLKNQLEELKSNRPDAVNTLSEARKLGDLSENGLYTAAKMRLRSIDSQIFRIEMQIKLSEVIEPLDNGIVGLGSKVEVMAGKEKRVLYLVGEFEANPLEDKISANSPLGKGLIGKKTNESFSVQTPSGKNTYKVTKIF